MIFFTSDTHFGHKRMLETRGFQTLDEMHAVLIEAWNGRVGPDDEVWHLGDFSFAGAQATLEIASRLHGKKRLVRGNHDHNKHVNAIKTAWQISVLDDRITDIVIEGQLLVLSHFPLLTWDSAHYGTWHLHGHSHGMLRAPETTRLDVGVDTHIEFAPYSWTEIKAIMSQRSYSPVDHHTPRP